MLNKKFLSLLSVSLLLAPLAMANEAEVESKLKSLYPKTQFDGIKSTPLPGIYEVMMGRNIAYVNEQGRYFIFGALYDMETQKDLTSERREQLDKVEFKDLPFKDSIKVVKGNGGKGKREFALFTDPDCPFCKRLEETLAGMDNYTVHIFMYPLESIHPNAPKVAESIWCSKDRKKAWYDYMLLEKQPVDKKCDNPIERNVQLGANFGMNGTPSMIHIDGLKGSGAMSRVKLEQWLGEM